MNVFIVNRGASGAFPRADDDGLSSGSSGERGRLANHHQAKLKSEIGYWLIQRAEVQGCCKGRKIV